MQIDVFEKVFAEKFAGKLIKSSFIVVNNATECAKYLKDNVV